MKFKVKEVVKAKIHTLSQETQCSVETTDVKHHKLQFKLSASVSLIVAKSNHGYCVKNIVNHSGFLQGILTIYHCKTVYA